MIRPRARCLILQLARLGDTVQSLMAVRAAKQLYPDVDFYMVVRQRFASAVHATPWLAGVIELPTEKILSPILKGDKSPESQALASRELAQWLSPVAAYQWDFLLNWTFSDTSSYLTAILPAKIKLGYSRQKDMSLAALDGWSQYIQAVVQGGVQQNIHLTDILTTQLLTALQIQLGDPTADESTPTLYKNFFQIDEQKIRFQFTNPSHSVIGIQLGASKIEKTWTPENWAALITLALKRKPEARFALMGGKEDIRAAEKIFSELRQLNPGAPGLYENRVESFVGKLNFDEWISLISKCQWIFSGDTAAIHLASVLGVRVLNLSLGPVRLEETGPYGNGHIVIRSDLPCEACHSSSASGIEHACREDVSPEAVYATWEYYHSSLLNSSLEEYFYSLGFAQEVGSVQVFRSRVRSADDGGGVVYEPVFHRPMSMEVWFSQVMGFVARSWYCGWVPTIAQELNREMLSPGILKQIRGLNESCEIFYKICLQNQRVSSELRSKSMSLKSDKVMDLESKAELQNLGKKLMELEALMARLAQTQPVLRAFTQLGRVMMHNLEGDRISDLGRQSMEAYRQLATGVAIVQQWATQTLGIARLSAVQSIAPESRIQH